MGEAEDAINSRENKRRAEREDRHRRAAAQIPALQQTAAANIRRHNYLGYSRQVDWRYEQRYAWNAHSAGYDWESSEVALLPTGELLHISTGMFDYGKVTLLEPPYSNMSPEQLEQIVRHLQHLSTTDFGGH